MATTMTKPVLSIQEIWQAENDRQEEHARGLAQKRADDERVMLGKLLAEFLQNYPEIEPMCAASGVKVSAGMNRHNNSCIVFTLVQEPGMATRKYECQYQLGCGKSIDMAGSWTEHSKMDFVRVLYKKLFDNDK